jgi:hypothetical protein
MLIGMFFLGNVMITPQQRNQVEIYSSVCGSFWGKLGGALSSEVAENCRQVQIFGQILSLEPLIYITGFALLVIGLIIPSGRKEVIVREVIKEPLEKPESMVKKGDEGEEEKIKSKVRFCSNCGAKVKGKYCTKCGEPV